MSKAANAPAKNRTLHGVTVQWVDVRPIAFALYLAPNESDHDGKNRLTPAAAEAMGYGSASWVRKYHAYVSATLRRLAGETSSAFVIGANAHFPVADDGGAGATGALRGACVARWSRMDMATELLTSSQWPQREDRSSWRTWRTNVVHLELPSFAKAVYHELVPSMLLVALHAPYTGRVGVVPSGSA